MIHRLLMLPLTPERHKKEVEYILKTAQLNGFKPDRILRLLTRKAKKLEQNELTTLFEQNRALDQKTRTITVTFHPALNHKIKKTFNTASIDVVNKADSNLSALLGSTKDKIEKERKSGIYQVQCMECDMYYIGQTCKSIGERLKQHLSLFRNHHFDKSAIADHLHVFGHKTEQLNLELLEEVNDRRRLNCIESIYIQNADESSLMNLDSGPLQSTLIKFAHT